MSLSWIASLKKNCCRLGEGKHEGKKALQTWVLRTWREHCIPNSGPLSRYVESILLNNNKKEKLYVDGGIFTPLKRYWSLRDKYFFLGMKLRNKIENAFQYHMDDNVPFRILFTKKSKFSVLQISQKIAKYGPYLNFFFDY